MQPSSRKLFHASYKIFQAFFKKALDDKNLGLDRDAEFIKPADLENEITNADIMEIIPDNPDDASGDNSNMDADDYTLDTTSYGDLGPESALPKEEKTPVQKEPRKDTTARKPAAENAAKPEEQKEKKGLLRKLFGGKDKEKKPVEQKGNDY